MKSDTFDELLENYSDGTLSEDEARELLSAFEADEGLQARFVDELKILNGLKGLPLLEDRDSIPKEVLQSILPEGSSRDLTKAVLTELRPAEELRPVENTGLHYSRFKRVTALAAAIIVGLVILSTFRSSGDSLAVIVHQVDAEWSEGDRLETGSKIGPRRLKLVSGLVRIDFPKGVRVTLEGPADLELITIDETRLHSGVLTAHVPPEGIGFRVLTSRAKVVDLGTTFGVSVDEKGSTDVSVYEGEVEVTSVASREEKIIREGNLVRLADDSDSLKPVKLISRSFRGWPVLFGVVNTGGQIRFINAQPVQSPADVTDSENIVIFPERFGTKVKEDVLVTLSSPGDYGPEDIIGREEVLSGTGRRVNTYLLQYNPPYAADAPKSDQKHFVGEVTFDGPIIAIIADRDQMIATDSSFGKKRFSYSEGAGRDLEHDDFLSLSQDRRTLKVDWLVMQSLKRGMDQIRVFVDAGEVE